MRIHSFIINALIIVYCFLMSCRDITLAVPVSLSDLLSSSFFPSACSSWDFFEQLNKNIPSNSKVMFLIGTPQEIENNPKSITGQYLSYQEYIPIPDKYNSNHNGNLTLKGARGNNLKNISVKFPLGKLFIGSSR